MPELRDNAKPEWKKAGYKTANASVVLTVSTFAMTVFRHPYPDLCAGSDALDPFPGVASRFSRGHYWMCPSMLLIIIFLVLMSCIHQYTIEKKIYSHTALLFAVLSAITLPGNYFIQISVIQWSLPNHETDGITMLTQINTLSIFKVLEELVYLMMSLALFCTIPVLSNRKVSDKLIRMAFLFNFVLSIMALTVISAFYGLKREYRFEVAVMPINWLTLIASGIFPSQHFKKYT